MIQIPVYILVIVVIIALVEHNPSLLIISGILLGGFLIVMIKIIWPGAITNFFKGGAYKSFPIALAVIGGLYVLFSRFPNLLWIFPILIVIGIIIELIEKIFKSVQKYYNNLSLYYLPEIIIGRTLLSGVLLARIASALQVHQIMKVRHDHTLYGSGIIWSTGRYTIKSAFAENIFY